MKKILLIILVIPLIANSQNIKLPIDTVITTHHESIIKGKPIKYVAEAGTQPVWDEDGKPIASLFYTYYRKKSKKDSKENPISSNPFLNWISKKNSVTVKNLATLLNFKYVFIKSKISHMLIMLKDGRITQTDFEKASFIFWHISFSQFIKIILIMV